MKALVLVEYGRLAYEDVPVPAAGADEVLVAVGACGICGSDVHGMDGSTGRRQPPVIMGHEAAGVIAELGADVAGWRLGQRVTFDSTVYCGRCWYCRRGQVNLCDDRRVLGVSCEAYRRHGAMAQYVAVPQRILYPLGEGLSFVHAAMVEPLSVAVHAVARAAPSLNATAVVVGTGMIGLLIVQALRAAGCGRIVAVDVNEERLDLAAEFGADETVDPASRDPAETAAELTDGRGADVVFEAVGLAETLRAAVACARKGAVVTLVGNLSPAVELPLQAVVTREITLHGSCASRGDYPACLDMIDRGRIRVDRLISEVAPLAEGAAWFDRLRDPAGGLMKVILEPPADDGGRP